MWEWFSSNPEEWALLGRAVIQVAIVLIASLILYYWLTAKDERARRKRDTRLANKLENEASKSMPRLMPVDHHLSNMIPTFKLFLINHIWRILGFLVFGGLLWLLGWIWYGR